MVSKLVGYLFAFLGLVSLVLSFEGVRKSAGINISFPLLNTILIGAAFILLAIGIIFVYQTGSSSGKKQAEEVPIYEGEGKNRRIVGYKVMKSK